MAKFWTYVVITDLLVFKLFLWLLSVAFMLSQRANLSETPKSSVYIFIVFDTHRATTIFIA